jgi:hypothetical protein
MFTDQLLRATSSPSMPLRGGVSRDTPERLKTMRALANGKKPYPGSQLEETSISRQPRTVKTLNRAISALVQEQKCEPRKPTNAFRSWTCAEDAQVCEEVRNEIDFHDIAKNHSPTVSSIVARLVELGEITAMPKKAA